MRVCKCDRMYVFAKLVNDFMQTIGIDSVIQCIKKMKTEIRIYFTNVLLPIISQLYDIYENVDVKSYIFFTSMNLPRLKRFGWHSIYINITFLN